MTHELLFDVFSAIIVVILIIGAAFQINLKNKVAKAFIILLISIIVYLALDAVNVAIEEKPQLNILAYITNALAFFTPDFIIISFLLYYKEMITDADKAHKNLVKIAIATSIAKMVTVFILLLTGNLFEINSAGLYVEKRAENVPYILSGVIMLEVIIITIASKKYFTKRQFIVVLIYLFVPIIGIVAEMLLNIYYILGITFSVAALILYVLIQDGAIEQSHAREALLEQISKTDLLTGSKNRRSFYEFTSSIPGAENFGVVFCDLNDLKYTNDHNGHEAGDELIKKFANLAFEAFGQDNVYRISGDEFVIIVKRDNSQDFFAEVVSFKETMALNKNLSAVGSAYGKGMNFHPLMSEAEAMMYKDKKENKNN